MRITGGGARGIPLAAPHGDKVRPATDALRQAVFSSLAARLAGARFLDLFAGTGAYGLEALSRGAAGGVFVEKNPAAVACIRRNQEAVCKSLRRDQRGLQIITGDARQLPREDEFGFDLVFIDPPYDLIAAEAPALFARLMGLLGRRPDPVIVFEMPGEIELAPAGWHCAKRIGKGVRQPTVCLFKRTGTVAAPRE